MVNESTSSYIVNVEVAICRGSNWLLIERGAKEVHASGLHSLVGGKVEENKSIDHVLEETARREVLEEIGIRLTDPLHYVTSSCFSLPNGFPVINLVFASFVNGDVFPHPVNRDEVADIVWMSAHDVENSTIVPVWTKRAVAAAEHIRRRIIHMSQ